MNKYGLNPPTSQSFQDSLNRVFGGGEGEKVWAKACLRAKIPSHKADNLDCDQLLEVACALEAMGGLATVVACSLKVRINTFKAITVAEEVL